MYKKISFALGLLALMHVALWMTNNLHVYEAVYYNFANIDDYKIFHNRSVKAAEEPQPWPVAKRETMPELPAYLSDTLQQLESVAFLVIRNDTIVYEDYYQGYSETSYSNSFSMAKSFVSALIGVALKEGKIQSIDESVARYIPEYEKTPMERVKIRHLLTMSSGTSWSESYSNPFSPTTKGYYGDDLYELIAGLKSVETPGQIWEYRSGDSQMLAFVLKNATGQQPSRYLQEKLWQPMGATRPAKWSLDEQYGDEKAFCCLNSNARDFARLGKLYLDSGRWKGQQLVPKWYVEESTSPVKLSEGEGGRTVDFYGYQWWLIPDYRGMKVFYARGILGQYILCIPAKNLIIVRLGRERAETMDGTHPAGIYTYLRGALELFG